MKGVIIIDKKLFNSNLYKFLLELPRDTLYLNKDRMRVIFDNSEEINHQIKSHLFNSINPELDIKHNLYFYRPGNENIYGNIDLEENDTEEN